MTAMAGSYVAFVAAAYGMAAVALGGLGLWVYLDARSVRRRLAELETVSGRGRAR
ncbi:heme exporter protein D [Aureimonas phyllosphaerae]|uniref:Heme exporter protein D n=2 Tax=Aureimonas phyllosphaerae TaxID=1166078 RepID=A0A7W6BLF9_9HYPH|nr:heme exporter protein D [Aureimonas phyllosphaerae]MBB3958743.1 heme exporter protein D [Aureimonas phyllosphaerae]SFF18669.1 heme exporter protein D [Aureimonas phyllosphaerae]